MTKSLSQAGLPNGFVGRMMGQIMAWHNNPDNRWTIKCLNISHDEQILEVGFGPGRAIEVLVKKNPSISIVGIDHSEAMLEAAGSRNKKAIQKGQVKLILGSVSDLPLEDSLFDKVLSINCIYFWDDLILGLQEIHRVLKPGGKLGITVRDNDRKAYDRFRASELEQMLLIAGFSTVNIQYNGVSKHPLICAIGIK